MRCELVDHAPADAAIADGTIDAGGRCEPLPRVAIDRVGPPREHAFPGAGEDVGSEQDRVEDRRGRAVLAVKIQRFTEPDDVLDALARIEMLGIEAPQALASV